MFEDHNSAISDILSKSGQFNADQLAELLQTAQDTGKSLADTVVDANLVERPVFLKMVADFLQLEFMAETPDSIEESVAKSIPSTTASWTT
jgi:hypothetical protein